MTTDRLGNANSAYSFDGVDDYIDCGNNDILQPVDSFSVSVLVKFESLPTDYMHVVSTSNKITNGFTGYTIQVYGKTAYFSVGNGTVYYHASKNNAIETGKWYSLVGVYRKDTQTLYINGSEVITVESGAYTKTSYSLNIGRMPIGLHYTHGVIDNVRIYNRVLSSSEIEDLYKEDTTPTPTHHPRRHQYPHR